MENFKIVQNLIFLLIIVQLVSCSQSKSGNQLSDADKKSITISWDANRESAVNTTGGGYHVHYSKIQDFDISKSRHKDVPYVSGNWAPVSTKLRLHPGTWYFKIVAYSSLGDGFVSEPSDQKTITIK